MLTPKKYKGSKRKVRKAKPMPASHKDPSGSSSGTDTVTPKKKKGGTLSRMLNKAAKKGVANDAYNAPMDHGDNKKGSGGKDYGHKNERIRKEGSGRIKRKSRN